LSQGTYRRVNVNTSDLRLVFVTIGKTEFNGERFEEHIEEITHFVKEVLFEAITKKMLDKIQALLQRFKPDVNKFIPKYNELYAGENEKLEHLILRILEKLRTAKGLDIVDSFLPNFLWRNDFLSSLL